MSTVTLIVPNDKVVYADRWQGELDSPSAEDLQWAAENLELPTPDDLPDWEPTDADWDDLYAARRFFLRSNRPPNTKRSVFFYLLELPK